MSYPLTAVEKNIKSAVKKALGELGIHAETIELSAPPEGMGDYAVACFEYAKHANDKPNNIAEKISKLLKIDKKEIDKAVNAGPYINFFINTDYLTPATINTILEQKSSYGCWNKKPEKIILEHTSANPTGPIHVGRARNPILGDTLARILRAYGYEVETQYYVNDLGKQVATLVWGMEHIKESSTSANPKLDHQLVQFYQKAYGLLEKQPEFESEIETILQAYEKADKKLIAKIKETCGKVLQGNLASLEKLNISIDKFVWESQFISKTAEVVTQLKNAGICKEEDGALYIDLENTAASGKEDSRFFITRKDGTTLYTTRDVSYHLYKFENSDIAINILGEDHKLEARQLEKLLTIVGSSKRPENIFYSFVSLPEGRMSTRAGRVVYLDDLIEEAVERAYVEVKKRREEFEKHEFKKISEHEMKKIAEVIGLGALRYNIIKVQNEKQIVFKWEEALSFEGSTAPFIQYAHARACSILSKGGSYNIEKLEFSKLCSPQELKLIKTLALLPKVIEESALTRKPYKLASYAYEVATQFNQFYRDMPVLKADDENLKTARLALVDAARTVLGRALELLGIEAPEEM